MYPFIFIYIHAIIYLLPTLPAIHGRVQSSWSLFDSLPLFNHEFMRVSDLVKLYFEDIQVGRTQFNQLQKWMCWKSPTLLADFQIP